MAPAWPIAMGVVKVALCSDSFEGQSELLVLCCCCGYQLSQGLIGKWGALAGMGHLRPKCSQFAPPDFPLTSEAG